MWLFSYAERRPRRTVTKRQAPQKRRCSGVLEAHVLEAHVAPSTDLQLEKLGLLRTVRLSLCTGHRGEVPSKPLQPLLCPPVGHAAGSERSRGFFLFSSTSALPAPTTGFLSGGACASTGRPLAVTLFAGTAPSAETLLTIRNMTGSSTSSGGRRPVRARRATGLATPTCRSETTSSRWASGSARPFPGRSSDSRRGAGTQNTE